MEEYYYGEIMQKRQNTTDQMCAALDVSRRSYASILCSK